MNSYPFDEHLGTGTFAEVYRSGIWAVKVSLGPEYNHLIRRESETLQCIKSDHPNYPRFETLLDVGPNLGLVYTFMSGQSLLDFAQLTENFLTVSEITTILNQLHSALKTIHTFKVSHRDIKLENCLFDRTRQFASLIDFGLSTRGKSRSKGGSHKYVSPKFVRNVNQEEILSFDTLRQNDYYGLGVICYILMMGEWPYEELPQPKGIQVFDFSSYVPPDLESAEELNTRVDTLIRDGF